MAYINRLQDKEQATTVYSNIKWPPWMVGCIRRRGNGLQSGMGNKLSMSGNKDCVSIWSATQYRMWMALVRMGYAGSCPWRPALIDAGDVMLSTQNRDRWIGCPARSHYRSPTTAIRIYLHGNSKNNQCTRRMCTEHFLGRQLCLVAEHCFNIRQPGIAWHLLF